MRTTQGRPKLFNEDEVLMLAMNYFWEYGYENASLDNLLSAMGIKKSSFYHTFKSKEEVFSRTLELYRKQYFEYFETVKKELGPKAALLKLADSTIQELAETGKVKGCLLMNSGKECYNRYDVLSRQIKIEFNFMLEKFEEFIKEAQALGEIPRLKDAKIIAGRYMNALNGLVMTIQVGASSELIEDLAQNLKEILE